MTNLKGTQTAKNADFRRTRLVADG